MPTPRIVVAALLATALAGAVPAHAGDPVLDGKKKRSLPFTFAVSDAQQHLLAETAGQPVDPEPADCAKPRCIAVPFTVKPAKGLGERTPLSARITWTSRTTRLWLSLVDVTGKSPVEKASCFSFYVTNGTAATIRVNSVKPGHRYALWISEQTVVAPDTVTGTVSFPATHTVADNPAPSPSELFVNGCNS
jgi:hypothetical protein